MCGRVRRLALAAQRVGDLGGEPAERLPGGVDEQPVALAVGWGGDVGLHGMHKPRDHRAVSPMIGEPAPHGRSCRARTWAHEGSAKGRPRGDAVRVRGPGFTGSWPGRPPWGQERGNQRRPGTARAPYVRQPGVGIAGRHRPPARAADRRRPARDARGARSSDRRLAGARHAERQRLSPSGRSPPCSWPASAIRRSTSICSSSPKPSGSHPTTFRPMSVPTSARSSRASGCSARPDLVQRSLTAETRAAVVTRVAASSRPASASA